MKLLLRAHDFVSAHHCANVLRAAGIACQVRNTALTGALGEIPFLDAAPQIWVAERDYTLARTLLDEAGRAAVGPAWRCERCGEQLEPQFAHCWSCGAPRP